MKEKVTTTTAADYELKVTTATIAEYELKVTTATVAEYELKVTTATDAEYELKVQIVTKRIFRILAQLLTMNYRNNRSFNPSVVRSEIENRSTSKEDTAALPKLTEDYQIRSCFIMLV